MFRILAYCSEKLGRILGDTTNLRVGRSNRSGRAISSNYLTPVGACGFGGDLQLFQSRYSARSGHVLGRLNGEAVSFLLLRGSRAKPDRLLDFGLA